MLESKEIFQTLSYFNNIMKIMFHFSITIITIFLIISLVLWLIGVKIKSEKAIKNGIRLSLSMLLFEFLMFGIIIFVAKS